MRTKSLVQFATAAALLAGISLGSRSASAQPIDQTVDANIDSALKLTLASAFPATPWALSITNNPNPETDIQLLAQANVPYALRDNCDSAAAKSGNENNLFQFRSGSYVSGGLKINSNLQIRALGAGAAVDINPTSGGDTLVNAGGQTPSPAAGRTHTVEVSNFVDFGDQSLDTATQGTYHMVITFTIVAGAV